MHDDGAAVAIITERQPNSNALCTSTFCVILLKVLMMVLFVFGIYATCSFDCALQVCVNAMHHGDKHPNKADRTAFSSEREKRPTATPISLCIFCVLFSSNGKCLILRRIKTGQTTCIKFDMN